MVLGSGSGPDRPADGPATAAQLDKVLSRAGLGSRRACSDLVARGKVTVDGSVVSDPSLVVDPETSVITVEGHGRVQPRGLRYLVLNKPPGVVATMKDPEGRPSLGDLLGPEDRGLFHVGRLEVDSAGLQLLTNDGELAQRLTAQALPRTYLVQLTGPVPEDLGPRLEAGAVVDGRRVRVDGFRVLRVSGATSLVEVVLEESAKRAVRRLFATMSLPVRLLVCTAVGPVALGDLPTGATRPVTAEELAALRASLTGGQSRDLGPVDHGH